MLTYLQNSDSKNAVDDATKIIDSYVKKVKKLPEVETELQEKYPAYADRAAELVERYWKAE